MQLKKFLSLLAVVTVSMAGLGYGLHVADAQTPLTAAIQAAPDSHDGQSAFTFELHFSEEFPISYKTLRDHATHFAGLRHRQ